VLRVGPAALSSRRTCRRVATGGGTGRRATSMVGTLITSRLLAQRRLRTFQGARCKGHRRVGMLALALRIVVVLRVSELFTDNESTLDGSI
jgi:hypothetical protein